jgi:hypothetical protein
MEDYIIISGCVRNARIEPYSVMKWIMLFGVLTVIMRD